MTEKNTDSKVIIIGLDGADWRLLHPWLERGELPAIGKLVSGGATGRLRSSIRPESSVAWSSFSTGVNPGKHGVFGFVERTGEGYGYRLANASSVRAPRFWDALGRHGLRTGLLNLPFTYPPAPLNGFLVTGMLTPGTHAPFAYPETLRQRLLDRFEDYVFDTGELAYDKALLVDKVRAHTDQQREVALLVLQEQPWDCFVVVFTGPDRLQHLVWSDQDPEHPLHNPETAAHFGGALLDHYRALDSAMADILAQIPPDTLVLLMSDHGFNGCARKLYVNRWLMAHGWLTMKNARTWRSSAAGVLSRLAAVPWMRRLKRKVLPGQGSSVDLQSVLFAEAIDWPRTRAYFGLEGGLNINLRGRELEGRVAPGDEYARLREEIAQELLALRDPESGFPVLADVIMREALYQGPYAERAPDLILEPQRANRDAAKNFTVDGSFGADEVAAFGSSAPYSANHALDGILVATGPGLRPGTTIEGARIWDIAPTVLAALSVPVPEYMDGRVLTEMFLPGHAPVVTHAPGGEPAEPWGEPRLYSADEEDTIQARLRNLGYLD